MEIFKIAVFCWYQYLGFFKKSADFFWGFRIQFCFQILTLDVEKYLFKPKIENYFFGREMSFLTKFFFFLNCSNFPVEAEKLVFQTKWVVFAPKHFAKFHND